MNAFEELQKQLCPSWRYKKFYILNYNTDQLSEDILTSILKREEPPKILTNERRGLTYWTYENRRCAVAMVQGNETLKPHVRVYYGSRYIIFHPKLQENVYMNELNEGKFKVLDRAYHILYDRSHIEIHHKNFFTNQTIQLDPRNVRVPNDLKNLAGRKLRLTVPEGNQDVISFDTYLLETIARKRNASFEISTELNNETDYGVLNIGVPFLGTDKILALGNTFISVLVPRSKPKPIISVLIDPFDYYIWIILFLSVLVLALVLTAFGRFLSKLSFLENTLEMIMCILGGPTRKYGGWFENQLITNYCLLSIVIVSSYQSLIISYLSYTRYRPEINTPDEIRNNCIFPLRTAFAHHLSLRASGSYESKRDDMCFLFTSRDNKHITTLLIENMRDIDESARQATKRHLRVADTTFFKFHLLYYFYNKSLVRELFPFYIHAFSESGLFDQYYKNKSTFAMLYKQEVFRVRAFGVGDLSIIFYLYIGGVIVSLIWFSLEIVLYNSLKYGRVLKAHWRNRWLKRAATKKERFWK